MKTALIWYCKNCGNEERAIPPVDHGDEEPCVHCEDGTARAYWWHEKRAGIRESSLRTTSKRQEKR